MDSASRCMSLIIDRVNKRDSRAETFLPERLIRYRVGGYG